MCTRSCWHTANYLWLSRGAHYTLARMGKECTATSVPVRAGSRVLSANDLISNASNFGMMLHVVVVSGDLAQGGVSELQRE